MIVDKLFKEKIITIAGKEYKLRPITQKELFQLRISDKPGLVFKENEKLWYTELPSESVRFTGHERKQLGHMCSSETDCCKRLSADLDPIGCAVIRDDSFSKYRRATKNKQLHCKMCLRIEKYKFITCGIETFNMSEDCLKVLGCTNCIQSKFVPNRFDYEESKRKIVALAQHLNPSIQSFSEIDDFAKFKV